MALPVRIGLRRRLREIAALPRFDIALVVGVILLAELEIWTPTGGCTPAPFPFGLCNFGQAMAPRPVDVVYTSVAALALLARRKYPAETLLFISVLAMVVALVWVASPGLGYFLPMLIAAYSVGRYHRGAHPWLVLAGAAVLIVAASIVHDLRVPGQPSSGSLATFYLVLLGALPMGRALQTRDLRAELSESEARQAKRARDEAALRAVTEERARLTRELHDIAAHGVSLIVVQAVAAQGVLDANPDRARSALESIEVEARQALAEMRRLLAVLQPGTPGDQPGLPPVSDALTQLIARVVAAGQPVDADLDCNGEWLSPGLQLTIYRCVQEALTNVVKHAQGARTTVSVRCFGRQIEVDVVNGPAGRPAETVEGGRGLVGMRERVSLYGGVLNTGPISGGGFRVHASIPISDAE
jgi:signal transduction histidine kinase